MNAGHDVVIAGGGPTGTMLAAELQLAGIDAVLVERRTDDEFAGSRAGGLHARTLELLDARGIVDRFVEAGQQYPAVGFGGTRLDMSDQPSRHNYLLGLWQKISERLLREWAAELGVPIRLGLEVTGFAQDEAGVDVELSDGTTLRADYLVGCDGGRSLVRKTADIDFPGAEPSKSWLLCEASWTEEPEWGFRHDALGSHALSKLDEPGQFGMVLTEPRPDHEVDPTLEDVRELLTTIYGTDFGVRDPIHLSRFTDVTRQASTYRVGRVLLAGDAAHIHPPLGGQGLNIGVQDALNLGWKLAQVVAGTSSEALLDTYEAERRPIAARVLQNTMAQVALTRPDARTQALGTIVTEWLGMDEPRRAMAAEMSGLGVHYDLGEGHPLLGRRMPDLELLTSDGPIRASALLHAARPFLLDLGEKAELALDGWAERIQLVRASFDGTWELPVLGEVAPPTAVLVRPDGYVAWVGEGLTTEGMTDALATWFGPGS